MNIAVSFRNWRKEEDLSSHTAVLSTFLNSDKHRINNKDHRVMLNWAQWWDPLTQEMILLPKKSPEGKYSNMSELHIEN